MSSLSTNPESSCASPPPRADVATWLRENYGFLTKKKEEPTEEWYLVSVTGGNVVDDLTAKDIPKFLDHKTCREIGSVSIHSFNADRYCTRTKELRSYARTPASRSVRGPDPGIVTTWHTADWYTVDL